MVRCDCAPGNGGPSRRSYFREAQDIGHIEEVLAIRPNFSRPEASPHPSGHASAPLVMLPGDMSDLDEIYRRLARSWPQEELAARYLAAKSHDMRGKRGRRDVDRALPTVATALPAAATLGVAVYVLHLLRAGAQGDLAERLIENANRSAASALHHCHRALELDAAAHSFTTDEWVPRISDVAAGLLSSARLDREPPTIVQVSQDAISWLSRAVIDLDKESAEAPNTLSQALGRLLAVSIFAQTAGDLVSSG